MRVGLLSIAVFALASPLFGDVVVLKNGSRIEGDVKKNPAGYVVTLPGGKIQFLSPSDVKAIEAGPTTAPTSDAAAKAKLASFRRSVELLDDPQKAIDRYQKFIEQNAGSVIESDAREDLATWQDRQKQGLVKFNNQWVSPQEKAALQEKAIRQADGIRKLLKQGRLKEAESAIKNAVAEDPQNPTVLYLRGLLQFRQDQVIDSRKSFEQVNKLVPKHAPTLNNLAVVLARQNQNPAALNYYDQAMTASPRNRDILNNVAEMLYNMPDEQRQSLVAQKVLKKFNEQDVQLARELGPQGLHRWGSTWVNNDQLETLQKAELNVKDKLDALSADFDTAKVRISNIDRELDENDRAMRRMDAMSVVRGSDGQLHQAGMPASYYQLQEDSRKLGIERSDQMAKLERLREQAKAVNQNLPVPKYTGIQRLMDENSAPLLVPESPASPPIVDPTTAPATTAPTATS